MFDLYTCIKIMNEKKKKTLMSGNPHVMTPVYYTKKHRGVCTQVLLLPGPKLSASLFYYPPYDRHSSTHKAVSCIFSHFQTRRSGYNAVKCL